MVTSFETAFARFAPATGASASEVIARYWRIADGRLETLFSVLAVVCLASVCLAIAAFASPPPQAASVVRLEGWWTPCLCLAFGAWQAATCVQSGLAWHADHWMSPVCGPRQRRTDLVIRWLARMLSAASAGSAVLSLAYLRHWLSLPELMVANAAMLAGMPLGMAARLVQPPKPGFAQIRNVPRGPIFLAIQAPRRLPPLVLLAIAVAVVCAGSVSAAIHGRPGLLAMSAVAAALSFLILLSILKPGSGSYMRLLQFVSAPFLRTLLPLATLPLAIATMLAMPVAAAAAAMSLKGSVLLLATGYAAALCATCAWLVGDILRHAGRRTEPFMLANMAAVGLCIAMPAIAIAVLLAQTALILRHGRKFWNAYVRTAT